MRTEQEIAHEMAEELRRHFGHDIRHGAGVSWLARCILDIRAEDLGVTPATLAERRRRQMPKPQRRDGEGE